MLAYKLHRIGKSILGKTTEPDGPKPSDALVWLQKAFSIVDQLEDKTAAPSELKVKHQSFWYYLHIMKRLFQISILRTMGNHLALSLLVLRLLPS